MCGRDEKSQAPPPKPLQEVLNDERAKNDRLERDLKDLQGKLKHAQQVERDLQKDLQDKLKHAQQVERDLKDLQDMLKHAQQALDVARSAEKSLRNELDDAKAQARSAEKLLRNELEDAKAQARSVEKSLRNELDDAKAQNKRLETELDMVRYELKNMRDELQHCRAARDELQRCRAAQVSSQLTEQGLRQDLDKAMIEKKKLKKELEEVHQDLSNTRGRLERAYALQVQSLQEKEKILEYKLLQATTERDAALTQASELANRLSTAMAKRDGPGTSSVRDRSKFA